MTGNDPDGTQLGSAGEGAGELLHGMEPPGAESEETNRTHVGVVPQGMT